MSDELSKIIQTYRDIYDIDITMYDEKFLNQVIGKRLSAIDIQNSDKYLEKLRNEIIEAEILLQLLNNNHTEFFRNPLTFAHLEQWILPNLMEAKEDRSEIRIWSAGCSTGQEPYSIAMLLENINSKKTKKTRYRIIATDISTAALKDAQIGIYCENDIRNLRVKDLGEYFAKDGDRYILNEDLKRNVNFSKYDLLDNLSAYPQESIFGNFDLVLCCNLLFYYKKNQQDQILEKLINSLDENGYLITGETEKHIVAKFNDLTLSVPPSPIFKKRRGAR